MASSAKAPKDHKGRGGQEDHARQVGGRRAIGGCEDGRGCRKGRRSHHGPQEATGVK